MKRTLICFATVFAGLLPLIASACPLCNSSTGQQVRAGIFGEDFWGTLLIVIAPFPVLLLGLAAYHFDWPPFGRRPAPATAINTSSDPSRR